MDEEWNALRDYAMKLRKDIPICGSLAEADLGMSRRYELIFKPASKGQLVEIYGITKYRANKPNSDLIDLRYGDVDIYAGSALTKAEKDYILKEIFPKMEKRLDQGYSVGRYRSIERLEGRAGALVFKADGTVQRLPANWQKEFLR